MSVRRKGIRQGVVGILKAANSGTGLGNGVGLNIFSSQASPNWKEDLPLVVVYARSETITELNVSPREYRRNLQLVFEVIAEAPEDPNSADGTLLEDLLDDIAEEIETELNRDETVGELAKLYGNSCKLVDALVLNNVEFEFRGDGALPTGSAILVYDVTYHEYRPAHMDQQTDVANIADFELVVAEWFVGHHDDAPDTVVEATDEVTIPTS